MEAVSQPGTRVSARHQGCHRNLLGPSSQSGTKHHSLYGHRDPQPRLITIPTHGSSHYRLRPFRFHPDVSRSPRAMFTIGAFFRVLTGEPIGTSYEIT